MRIDSAASPYGNSRVPMPPAKAGSGSSFADTLAAASAATAAAAKDAPGETTDYTSMTRQDMRAAAQALYDAGKIDLHQLGMLQMAGPIGKAGPNGAFIPFTAAERAAIDSAPMNHIQIARDAISGVESRGGATDPKSGYRDWLRILSVMQG